MIVDYWLSSHGKCGDWRSLCRIFLIGWLCLRLRSSVSWVLRWGYVLPEWRNFRFLLIYAERNWRDVDISSSGRLSRRLRIGLTIKEEKVWFEFLQVAVGNRESLSGGISDADWLRLFDFCKKQALIGIGFTAVEKRNVLLNEKPMYWGGRTLDDLCA